MGLFCPSSFAKHTTEYMKTALLAMMQKTTILAAESMLLDQKDTKAAKEVAKDCGRRNLFFCREDQEVGI